MKKPFEFEDLYIECLKDLYDAENQILKALPKITKAASSPELKKALEGHRRETEGHVERLEQIFENCDQKPKGKRCEGMKGLLEEGDEDIKDLKEKDADPMIRDAAIIGACQKVEHYEIASYGTAKAFAQALGDKEGERLLDATL